MRIAVFHNSPSGGAKRALYEMARRLAARKHEIDAYTLSCAEHNFCDLRPFVSQHREFSLKPLPLFPSPFGLLNDGMRTADIVRLHSVQRAIADEINRGTYDVALVSNDQFTTSPIALKFLQIPSVYYCHDALRVVYDPPIVRPYSQLVGFRYWVNRLNILRLLYFTTLAKQDKASLRSATLVLVNSRFSRETIYRFYAVSSQVCYLGVDNKMFSPRQLERDEYVMSVGSVNSIKGFDFIVDSLALIPRQMRPPLLIVGNFTVSDERYYLEEKAHRSGVKIGFRVLVTNTELVELYNRARITLCAPILEPFGFVPLESMACGTPVIGVAEGGIRETIRHGETGLLTDRDPDQFAAAIIELLTNPAYGDKLGKRGPKYVQENWNWEDSVTRLEVYLKKAATGSLTTTRISEV